MDLRDIKEFLKDSMKYILVIFLVLFLVLYVITVQQIVGSSMSPTLKNQDVVLLSKINYHFTSIKRFDVVSLTYADTKYLVKRVIGLPHEKITYQNNILYVNGKAIKEPFLKKTVTKDFSIQDLGYDQIPKDKYLVLGDNRENSLDSREIGLVSKKDILGKVLVKFWPITEFKIVK